MALKTQVQHATLALAQRFGILRRAAQFVADQTSYQQLCERFVSDGKNSRFDENCRREILRRFARIDQAVPTATTPSDGLFLAAIALNAQGSGGVVECGCYAGASSAKLSILAKLRGWKLSVFDSFEGLPDTDDRYLRDHHCRQGEEWVKATVQKYGEISVCRFVPGWFSKTLALEHSQNLSLVFADVDLAPSARDCFVSLWPQLSNSGVYVTHDTAYIKVLQELYCPDLWKHTFQAIPPILFGAGYGLSDKSPHLGYMVKGEGLSADYLKSLTLSR
jgi:O-methyltransferase